MRNLYELGNRILRCSSLPAAEARRENQEIIEILSGLRKIELKQLLERLIYDIIEDYKKIKDHKSVLEYLYRMAKLRHATEGLAAQEYDDVFDAQAKWLLNDFAVSLTLFTANCYQNIGYAWDAMEILQRYDIYKRQLSVKQMIAYRLLQIKMNVNRFDEEAVIKAYREIKSDYRQYKHLILGVPFLRSEHMDQVRRFYGKASNIFVGSLNQNSVVTDTLINNIWDTNLEIFPFHKRHVLYVNFFRYFLIKGKVRNAKITFLHMIDDKIRNVTRLDKGNFSILNYIDSTYVGNNIATKIERWVDDVLPSFYEKDENGNVVIKKFILLCFVTLYVNLLINKTKKMGVVNKDIRVIERLGMRLHEMNILNEKDIAENIEKSIYPRVAIIWNIGKIIIENQLYDNAIDSIRTVKNIHADSIKYGPGLEYDTRVYDYAIDFFEKSYDIQGPVKDYSVVDTRRLSILLTIYADYLVELIQIIEKLLENKSNELQQAANADFVPIRYSRVFNKEVIKHQMQEDERIEQSILRKYDEKLEMYEAKYADLYSKFLDIYNCFKNKCEDGTINIYAPVEADLAAANLMSEAGVDEMDNHRLEESKRVLYEFLKCSPDYWHKVADGLDE